MTQMVSIIQERVPTDMVATMNIHSCYLVLHNLSYSASHKSKCGLLWFFTNILDDKETTRRDSVNSCIHGQSWYSPNSKQLVCTYLLIDGTVHFTLNKIEM